MPGATKEDRLNKVGDDEKSLSSIRKKLKSNNKIYSSLSENKYGNLLSGDTRNGKMKRKIFDKASVHKSKSFKKQPSLSDLDDKIVTFKTKGNIKLDDVDVKCRKIKQKIKKGNNNAGLDEASRLQRRTRYLLIKIKLEQNLIDAYSTEGWKGQSREKLKPEKELQRAKRQILKCKLGIREVIHQLDLLSSVGCINNSKIAPDGSVHHDHIVCAKCELQEAFRDNDIILCDGTCNRAFHQKCLDPPLSTENIPPEDEGWFCKFCECKMEVLEATNAHLGTHFSLDINWREVFQEEAALPEGGNLNVCQAEEWPSDDSQDDDYDPERIEQCCVDGVSVSECDNSDCSSSFLGSLEDEPLLSPGRYEDMIRGSFNNSLELTGVDLDEINAGGVLCRPRQRAAVDYTKLYDEMFGKNSGENEQVSEDEDWGPTKRRRKGKETDAASTLMTLGKTDKNSLEEKPAEATDDLSNKKIKRPIFRLPHNAVEKLRLVFAENELPVRSIRESLSEQLGVDIEKVNKWFKNARYLSLKVRKAGGETISEDASSTHKESVLKAEWDLTADKILSKNKLASQTTNSIKRYTRRKNNLLTHSLRTKQGRTQALLMLHRSKIPVEFGDDESLKHLRDKARLAKKKGISNTRVDVLEPEAAEMERLHQISTRVKKLLQTLLQLPSRKVGKSNAISSNDSSVIFVPVAELREKT